MMERSSRASRIAQSRWWTYGAIAIVVVFAYTLCRRAINLTDEGYLLSQVLDMLNGKVLYRDMDAFVTPGIWFLLAGLFKVVDPSVLASRSLSFAGYLATLFVGYRIVTAEIGRAWGWATVGVLMIFTVWAFPAWTSAFYSPIAILFALAALERLLRWRESARVRDLVACGFLLGSSIVCKQNYGAFATAGVLFALVAFRVEARDAPREAIRSLFFAGLQLSAGALIILLPTLAYLAAQGALAPAFYLLVLHPFDFMSRQDIPYPSISLLWARQPMVGVDLLTYGAFSRNHAPNPFFVENPALGILFLGQFLERLHFLLFWLPVLGLVVGAFLVLRPSESRRPIDGRLFAVLSVAGFVYLGVFPRADFNHLMNVYQPVIVAGVLVTQRVVARAARPWSRPARAAMAFASGVLLLYAYTAVSWYAHTLRTMDSPIAGPRGGVLVSSVEQMMIDFQVEKIREMSDDGDYVLTVPALAMFNFLADRRMPGRFYNLYEHHIAQDGGAGVVAASEANHVELVVSDYNNFFSDRVGLRVYAPVLADYLRTHFDHRFDVAGDRFRYLTRRETPRPTRRRIDVADTCTLDPGNSVYVREHLLFASLYQIRNAERPRAPVETPCTFVVPEEADLVVSINYRRPQAAARGTSLSAEIWLDDDGGRERLFSEVVPVRVQDGWTTPAPPEFRVDLSRFAGRTITIRFRTTFRGRVRMNPLDLGGFGLVWQDPRLEPR